MMRVMKTVGFLCALLVVTLMVQNALALPYSSFIDGNGKSWKGNKTYDGVYVEWAVYDIGEQNPWADKIEFPTGSSYIYAYQIGNLDEDPIESFYLLEAFGGSKINWSTRAMGTQAVADKEGIMPVLPCQNQAEWTWSPLDGDGFIMATKYSAILLFGSSYAPIAGGFSVTRNTDEGDFPTPPSEEVPEPGTIALLGSAVVWSAARWNKKRRVT